MQDSQSIHGYSVRVRVLFYFASGYFSLIPIIQSAILKPFLALYFLPLTDQILNWSRSRKLLSSNSHLPNRIRKGITLLLQQRPPVSQNIRPPSCAIARNACSTHVLQLKVCHAACASTGTFRITCCRRAKSVILATAVKVNVEGVGPVERSRNGSSSIHCTPFGVG